MPNQISTRAMLSVRAKDVSRWMLLCVVWQLALLAANSAVAWAPSGANDPAASDCATCHAAQAALWQGSHHALAMQAPKFENLLGNFDTKIQHGDLAATFGRDAQSAWVSLKEGSASPTKHRVVYAFGVHPLQQYLTQAPGGRLQVLPLAWDARISAEGGQRWYALHAPNTRPATDRFHWQQPLQNWNGMCADCHATNLQRNYDPQTNEFATFYQEPNVGCLACHRPQESESSPSKSVWQRQAGEATARLSEPRDNGYMDGCAACHSLRTPLTDGFAAGASYLDHFQPSLLEPNLYHPDGQIKEEVYVWGSFLQSKMFAMGVSCNDCHDPHSAELKLQGDALCGQCHALNLFAQTNHHGHAPNDSGARCVNCHMPATTYMGVDARRDHKFIVPRPHLAEAFGVPNACTNCHADKGSAWAAQQIAKQHAQPAKLTKTQQAVLVSQGDGALGNNPRLDMATLDAVLADPTIPGITQASVLTQQARLYPPGEAPVSVAKLAELAAAEDNNALLALSALGVSKFLPPDQRLRIARSSLSAAGRAFRVAAADVLLGVSLPDAVQTPFVAAREELAVAQSQSAWRGEGRMNLALTQQRLGKLAEAEQQYLQALKIDPYFAPAYLNLADLYRQQQRSTQAAAIYAKGLAAVPKDASLRYSYTLHLVRLKQMDEALIQSQVAIDLAPSDAQMATLYVLVLDGLGRTEEGLAWLQSNWASFADAARLRQLGASLAQKIQNPALYGWFQQAPIGSKTR